MTKIEKIWFSGNRIYVLLNDGSIKSRPLEAYPLLMDATDEQRNNFKIWAEGQSIRWETIDEDIHISSFDETAEPNPNNPVAKMLDATGVNDITAFAKMIGMKKTKLDLFRYGIWKPSITSLLRIKEGLRQISNDIAAL